LAPVSKSYTVSEISASLGSVRFEFMLAHEYDAFAAAAAPPVHSASLYTVVP
jgi:hypothetical protein